MFIYKSHYYGRYTNRQETLEKLMQLKSSGKGMTSVRVQEVKEAKSNGTSPFNDAVSLSL